MSTTWRRLGAIDPAALVEARLLLHHAAQLVTAPGRSLLEPRPDDSHTAFEWRAEVQALVGETIPGERPWRAGLRLADLTLLVLDETTDSADALLLAGRTLKDGFAWLRERARDRGTDVTRLSRELPYDLPAHPLARGAAFPPVPLPEFAELARHFANADRVFRSLAASRTGASPVLCWPHHFDLGGVIALDPAAGDRSPTVGFGLSAGDDGIAEPYWYVNLSPRPEPLPDPLPPLPGAARWNVEGWLGAVLTTTAIVAGGDAEEQESRARGFLAAGVRAARGLLGQPDA